MSDIPDSPSQTRRHSNPWGSRHSLSIFGFFLVLLLLVVPVQAQDAQEPQGAEPEFATAAAEEDEGCTESATVICLLDGRYEVTIDYSTADGDGGAARVARPRTADSGLFYFFNPGNWEVLIKVLDACDVNEHHWVFAASATDLGLEFEVRDTVTDLKKMYTKDPGGAAPAITDVGAFPLGCEA